MCIYFVVLAISILVIYIIAVNSKDNNDIKEEIKEESQEDIADPTLTFSLRMKEYARIKKREREHQEMIDFIKKQSTLH